MVFFISPQYQLVGFILTGILSDYLRQNKRSKVPAPGQCQGAARRQVGLAETRNSFSKTDPDATFMHMKDDHMRNAQLKPGYNMQIGVEAGYVVHCQAYAQRNDVRTLIPFLESWDRLHPEASYENIVADAGYESEALKN